MSDYDKFKQENKSKIDSIKADDIMTFNSVKRSANNQNQNQHSNKKSDLESLYT